MRSSYILQPFFPEFDQRLPVQPIGCAQGGEVLSGCGFVGRREFHGRKVESSEQLRQQQARDAAVEIWKRVDGEQAALGKCQRFNQQEVSRRRRETNILVGEVIANEHGHLMRCRRRVLADFDFARAKFPSPIRGQVTADAAMQIQQESFVQRLSVKDAVFDVRLYLQHAFSQQRRELGVRQNAARRFYEARGVRRLCRVFSHSKSTGSPSNAMLAATWRGTSAQRRALRSAGFSLRHCETFSCQVMPALYTKHLASGRVTFRRRRFRRLKPATSS